MSTQAEIAAAIAALDSSITADRQAREQLAEQAAPAVELDALADQIEALGALTIASKDYRARVSGAAVATVVTFLRNRAQAIRDGIVLPG